MHHCPSQANAFLVSSAPPRLPPRSCPSAKSPSPSSCAPCGQLPRADRVRAQRLLQLHLHLYTSHKYGSIPSLSSFSISTTGATGSSACPSLASSSAHSSPFPPFFAYLYPVQEPKCNKKKLAQARGALVRRHRRRFSRPHMSILVRMDIPLERAPDCANHGLKSLQRRRAPPFHDSPFLSPSLQPHREFIPNDRTPF